MGAPAHLAGRNRLSTASGKPVKRPTVGHPVGRPPGLAPRHGGGPSSGVIAPPTGASAEKIPATPAAWRAWVQRFLPAEGDEHRRDEPRRLVAGVTVRIAFHHRDNPRAVRGKLRDTSDGGLQILLPVLIKENTLVVIQIETPEAYLAIGGIVMHCTQTVGGYKIGVRLQFD